MSTVGVDVGGTKILACRVEDGRIAASKQADTPQNASELAQVVAQLVCDVWSDDTAGVGIGLPGYIHQGALYHAPNLSFLEGENVEELFSQAVGSQVVCENDANCFALAEYTLGAGKECKHMIGVILGTGVGAGLILNGALYTGAIGGAGEVGDMLLLEGSWEDHVSGPGIMRAYNSFGGTTCAHPGEVWESSEEAALQTREHTLNLLGRFLGSLINVFNPERIVLGGSVSTLPFYEELSLRAQKHCSQAAFSACTIMRHEVNEHAGVIGAAMLVK